MSRPIWAYCETPTQVRIAARLRERLPQELQFKLLLGAWSEEIGQRAAAEASGIETDFIALESGRRPGAAWGAIATSVAHLLEPEAVLLLFQDQHMHAQALVVGAREAGATTVLAQDGFLDFDMSVVAPAWRALWPLARALDSGPTQPSTRLRPRIYDQLYKLHFFGHTRPDMTFVFGPALARRLQAQFGLKRESIFVTGPLLDAFKPAAAPRPLARTGALRVLFIDQCALRYQRITEQGWRESYLPTLTALRPFELTVKLHPAQTETQEREVREAAGAAAVFLDRAPLTRQTAETYDVAVTMSSTAFMDCLAVGTPVVFCDAKGARDRMPRIASPLLRNVASNAELLSVLEARRNGVFEANKGGAPLGDFVADGGGTARAAQLLADWAG